MGISIDFLNKEYGNKITHRIGEYTNALEQFAAYQMADEGIVVEYSDESAEEMTYLYYSCHHELVRPFLGKLSNRYKIASVTELIINILQPLYYTGADDNDRRILNAHFGMFCAMNIIEYFKDGTDDEDDEQQAIEFKKDVTTFDFKGGVENYYTMLEEKMQNHFLYMHTLEHKLASPPAISNSFVWELFHFFFLVRWQAIAI